MVDPKDNDQGLDDEQETDTGIDTGADDDGPKNDPVPVDPNQIPLDPDGGDEGDREEND